MKKLKQLLLEGNDAKILNYVKNQLADKIDIYMDSLDKVPELNNEFLKLQIDSVNRQKSFEKLSADVEECNKTLINALEKRINILEDKVCEILKENNKLKEQITREKHERKPNTY